MFQRNKVPIPWAWVLFRQIQEHVFPTERVIRQTQFRVIVFNTHMSARQLLCRDNKSQPPPDLQRRSALNISYSLTSPIC
jgi:hypothetical protein